MNLVIHSQFLSMHTFRKCAFVALTSVFALACSNTIAADRDKSPVTIDPNGGTKKTAYSYINEKLSADGKRLSYEVPSSHGGEHIQIKKSKVYGDKKAFFLYSHVTGSNVDNDGTNNNRKDRVRTEIKVGVQSPKWMKGRPGDKYKYEWEFRIPSNFKDSTSFTHFFQIKASAGNSDASHPIITLTASRGKMRIIHKSKTKEKSTSLISDDLSKFLGKKLKVVCEMTVGDGSKGKIKMVVTDTGPKKDKVLFSINKNLDTWRGGNQQAFVRPKWGIYRAHKVKDSNGRLKSLGLKNETILFRKIKVTKL